MDDRNWNFANLSKAVSVCRTALCKHLLPPLANTVFDYCVPWSWYSDDDFKSVTRRKSKRLLLYKKLAREKVTFAMVRLAYYYEHGWSKKKRKGEDDARKLYLSALNLHDEFAKQSYISLGLSQLARDNVKLHPILFSESKKGAEWGCPEAFYTLGHCFRYGIGTAIDKKASWEWIARASEAGYGFAQVAMAEHLESEDPNDERIEPLILAAAKNGECSAYCFMGERERMLGFTEEHEQTLRHFIQAIGWFEKAAERKHMEGQYSLAYTHLIVPLYVDCDQIQKKYHWNKCLEFAQKSHEQGYRYASHLLELCQEKGPDQLDDILDSADAYNALEVSLWK